MLYYPSSQLQAKNSFYIDIYEIAHFIESLLSPVLRAPDVGLYLPNQVEPVLKQGVQYWFERPVETEAFVSNRVNMALESTNGFLHAGDVLKTTTPWNYWTYEYYPVETFEEVTLSPFDVVDVNPNFSAKMKHVVLPHHLANLVSLTPTVPVIGIRLMEAIVSAEIESTRGWLNRPCDSLEEILMPFLLNSFANLQHIQNDPWFQESLAMLTDNMQNIIVPLRDMLRIDPFEMYQVSYSDNFQISLYRLGDYRVQEWERITSDPQYQHYLALRNSSAWNQIVQQQEERAYNPYG